MAGNSAERELVSLFDEAKKAADLAASAGGSVEANEARCLDALRQLQEFPVNMPILVSTQARISSLDPPSSPSLNNEELRIFSIFFLAVIYFRANRLGRISENWMCLFGLWISNVPPGYSWCLFVFDELSGVLECVTDLCVWHGSTCLLPFPLRALLIFEILYRLLANFSFVDAPI